MRSADRVVGRAFLAFKGGYVSTAKKYRAVWGIPHCSVSLFVSQSVSNSAHFSVLLFYEHCPNIDKYFFINYLHLIEIKHTSCIYFTMMTSEKQNKYKNES